MIRSRGNSGIQIEVIFSARINIGGRLDFERIDGNFVLVFLICMSLEVPPSLGRVSAVVTSEWFFTCTIMIATLIFRHA